MHNMITDERSGIHYRKWLAAEPRAVLLLVHGMGAHSERWQFLAEYFLEKNISSYAIELRGFGQTHDHKGHIDSFRRYYTDIEVLRDIAVSENSGTNIFLLGESLGALIAFIDVSIFPGLFDGLICVSPAFKSRLRFSLLDYLKIGTFSLILPKKQIRMPFTSSMCTRDEEYQSIMDPDEREHRLATPRLLMETAKAQLVSASAARKIQKPVLFLLAGEDKLVVPQASESIFRKIVSSDKTLIEYPKMYHALSIEEGRERVFSDISEWIDERIQYE